MRRVCVAAALAAIAVTLLAVAADADPGDVPLDKRTQPPVAGAGPRDYYVAVPARPAEPRRLVVFLHGCNQTAPDVAVGTRIARAATDRGWYVALPEQRVYEGADVSDGNGSHCWNWFLPQHQARDAGEPASIAAITRTVAAEFAIDPARIFVTGISAGADMTTIMGVTYPDLFAAIAPYSGCAYLSCADVTGTAAHAAMGDRARAVPALIAQGTADMVNNVAMGDTALRQWLAADDLGDDGAANGSVPQTPTAAENVGFDDPAATPGNGDPCVGNSRLPCAGGAAGVEGRYPYTRSTYAAADGTVVVEHWLIHGLNHAYPGGDPRGTFVDPLGPDLTSATLDFFDAHPMNVASAVSAAPAGAGHGNAERSAQASREPDASLPATGRATPLTLVLAAIGSAIVLRRIR